MPKFTPYTVAKPTPQEVNLKTVLRELQKDILSYNEVSATIDGDTEVMHKLGRQPIGWILIDKQDTGDIIRLSWDSLKVTLTSSTSIRCKILFY